MSHDVVFHATLFPGLHHGAVQREPAPGSPSNHEPRRFHATLFPGLHHGAVQREPTLGSPTTSSRYPLRSHVSGGATTSVTTKAPTSLEQETRETAVALNQEDAELDGLPNLDDSDDDDDDDTSESQENGVETSPRTDLEYELTDRPDETDQDKIDNLFVDIYPDEDDEIAIGKSPRRICGAWA
jgi:hypothetical protein